MFKIDGFEFNFPCDVSRSVELKESDVSGLMLNKKYYRDFIGAYLTYNVKLAIPRGMENDYAELFERLIDTNSHYFQLPYNQTELRFFGMVSDLSDDYYRKIGGRNIWKNISFTIKSNEPRGMEDESENQ